MDIDKKLVEFEDEFGFKDKAAYGVFLPDGIVTAMNNYYDEVKEWVMEALNEAYQKGQKSLLTKSEYEKFLTKEINNLSNEGKSLREIADIVGFSHEKCRRFIN